MNDQSRPTAAQKRHADILINAILIAYLVTAFFATSNVAWYFVMALLGMGMFVAGFTACVHTPKGPRRDQ